MCRRRTPTARRRSRRSARRSTSLAPSTRCTSMRLAMLSWSSALVSVCFIDPHDGALLLRVRGRSLGSNASRVTSRSRWGWPYQWRPSCWDVQCDNLMDLRCLAMCRRGSRHHVIGVERCRGVEPLDGHGLLQELLLRGECQVQACDGAARRRLARTADTRGQGPLNSSSPVIVLTQADVLLGRTAHAVPQPHIMLDICTATSTLQF